MKTTRTRRLGFSLIELLVAAFVGSLVAGAVITVMVSQFQLNSTHNRNMANSQNLRDSLDYMGEEASLCGNRVAEPFILDAEPTDFRFIGDVNGDGNWDEIRYFLQDGNIMRSWRVSVDAGASWDEVSTDSLLDGVASLAFDYYAPDDAAPAAPSDITSIGITVSLDPDAHTTSFTTGRVRAFELASRVTLRNRKLNNLQGGT